MVRVQIAYFILYGCLASMLPFLAAFFVLKGRAKRNGAAFSNSHTALVVLFALYIFAVFWVTGAGTLFDLMRYGLRTQGDKINLLPFSREISVTGYLLNAVLFMPLGFLLPLAWADFRKLWRTLAAGTAFSLLIELSQLFNSRQSDVDDLIMNTLGALLGYLLFKVFARAAKWGTAQTGGCKWEPAVYIGAMYLGRFLLFDEMGLARALYHF